MHAPSLLFGLFLGVALVAGGGVAALAGLRYLLGLISGDDDDDEGGGGDDGPPPLPDGLYWVDTFVPEPLGPEIHPN